MKKVLRFKVLCVVFLLAVQGVPLFSIDTFLSAGLITEASVSMLDIGISSSSYSGGAFSIGCSIAAGIPFMFAELAYMFDMPPMLFYGKGASLSPLTLSMGRVELNTTLRLPLRDKKGGMIYPFYSFGLGLLFKFSDKDAFSNQLSMFNSCLGVGYEVREADGSGTQLEVSLLLYPANDYYSPIAYDVAIPGESYYRSDYYSKPVSLRVTVRKLLSSTSRNTPVPAVSGKLNSMPSSPPPAVDEDSALPPVLEESGNIKKEE